MTIVATPYDSAKLLFGSNIPTWLNEDDAKRLAAYALYESIYRNYPDTFKLTMRGTNEHPIYVPSGRIICNTINRYVCRKFDWVADSTQGSTQQQELLKQAFDVLFKRVRFRSIFNSNKLMGIVRGDAAWMITANAEKPEGSRIDIETLDPGTVFPIPDEHNSNKYTGVDVVEQEVALDGTLYVKRQRWLKSTHPEHPAYTEYPDGTPATYDGDISYEMDSFEVADWEDPDKRKVFSQGPSIPQIIIAGITRLPVYWYNNEDIQDSWWGYSELAGLETLIAGVNQTASDEDISLAIAGLGMYVTDAGAPSDSQGNDTDWIVGPAEVIEVKAGKSFTRVKGIESVTPMLEHMKFLQEQAFRTTGASDVAQGQVDVNLAESGIALQLRMGPLIDAANIKQDLVVDCLDQMFFDLRQWLDVYEGVDSGEYDPLNPKAAAVVVSKVGDQLPENKKERFGFLMQGYNAVPPLFSGKYVRDECRRMGWDLPEESVVMQELSAEEEFFAQAQEGGDFSGRLTTEADATQGAAG